MPVPRTSRVRLIGWLELGLGLELYACAVLALHARGLRASPLDPSPSLVLPALVIPPVFYVLVSLVSVRPLSLSRVTAAAAVMCGLHAVLVMGTGALFMIPDLLDYGAALAFALWGSPAVTLLQLTAAPLVFARLRPLLLAPRAVPRPASPQRRVEQPGITPLPPAAAPREPVAAPPAPTPAQRVLAMASAGRPQVMAEPVAPPLAPPPVAPPPLAPPRAASPLPAPIAARAASGGDAMVRIPFDRIAEQLPVEMFARGQEGLNAALRPGVSLLVPRRLLLPHLAEGLAPVRWEIVADQFPRDELRLTHDEIARRLPNASLILPLDEVVPQIPLELLALSTPPVDVFGIEEFAPPFQPHVPPETEEGAEGEPKPVAREAVAPVRAAPPRQDPETSAAEPRASAAEPEASMAEAEPAASVEELEPSMAEPAAEAEAWEAEPAALMAETEEEPEPDAAEPELDVDEPEPAVEAVRGRTDETRRIAALLAPLVNGLELGERASAGTRLLTAMAPSLDEDAVVRTVARVAPFLTDARLSEAAAQATLTASEATVVLTPLGSPHAGAALLVTALGSRASLALLERLSRSAALAAGATTSNGERSGSNGGLHGGEAELRTASVPPSVRDVLGSLTAFGPVAPTVLRDAAGALSACLFLPDSVEPLPLARFARDLHDALEGAEIGPVTSVILKVGGRRLVLRVLNGVPGRVTMLVGLGRIDRPGLARIELDRAAARLAALGRV